jgi:DNA mismatch repair ATPase MutS
MKPRLMYPDRDFDQYHVFRELMYRFRKPAEEPQLPPHQHALMQDLELRTLLEAMAGKDEFLFEVAQEALLSGLRNDLGTILYRQEVLEDCLENGPVIKQIYSLTVEAVERTRKQWWSLTTTFPSSLLYDAIHMLEALLEMLRKLRIIAEEQAARFESKAFTAMFAMVSNELTEEYLATIESYLNDLKFRNGVLLSAELGDSNESTNLKLRKLDDEKRNWLERLLGKKPPGYTFHLAERDHTGGKILSDMRHRGISRAAVALAQSAVHVLSFFRMLRTELAFYVGCLNLHGRLTAKGEPFCFPTPAAARKREHRFSGLYDVCLSLHMDSRVVGNSAVADGKNLVMITGANQGGKSCFLRSIGLAQIMMQSGIFVGAESFTGDLCSGLFTHYKREEDVTMKSGKFDEELARMSGIIDRLQPNSMVLFNESFAATNEREGSEIAGQIVRALLEKQVKVFYVTHLYEFARTFFDARSEDSLLLRAERLPDGTRTFRVLEGEPFETSYGEDLYRQIFESRDGCGDRHSANSAECATPLRTATDHVKW